MSWQGFAIGLLAGWATAFAIQVAISRAYLAQQREERDRMGADPLMRHALKTGQTLTVTLNPKEGQDP